MFLHPFASRATKLFCTFAATKNKTDERGFYQTSPLGADSRRYRSLRAVDYPERGTAGVVSYVVGWCAVLYRTFLAEETAETSCPRCSAYRFGGIVAGCTLAVFLWQYQGLERIYRGGLPVADELLYRFVRSTYQPSPGIGKRNRIQSDRSGGHCAHFSFRYPLSDGYSPGSGVVGTGFSVYHLQQESGIGLSVGHYSAL